MVVVYENMSQANIFILIQLFDFAEIFKLPVVLCVLVGYDIRDYDFNSDMMTTHIYNIYKKISSTIWKFRFICCEPVYVHINCCNLRNKWKSSRLVEAGKRFRLFGIYIERNGQTAFWYCIFFLFLFYKSTVNCSC